VLDPAALYSGVLCIGAGLASGGLGSLLYEHWAPHEQVHALKQARRATRAALKDPELPFRQALSLACSDLHNAVHHCRLVLMPALISAAPAIATLIILENTLWDGEASGEWLFLGSAAIAGILARLVIWQSARTRRP